MTLNKKKLKLKRKQIYFLIITFLVGMLSSIFIFNFQQKDRNSNIEITFIDSHKAIVFWTTKDKTIGFVKYGLKEKSLERVIYQTSSDFGTVHAVVIDNIPIEGGYISLHNESDSKFLFSKTQRIVFDAKKYLE